MLFSTNIEKVFEVFARSPTKGFQLREISRLIKLGLPTVRNHVHSLEKKGLIQKVKGNVYDFYQAKRQSLLFKAAKRAGTLASIAPIGERIISEIGPTRIVLLGPASAGEDNEDDPIVIYIDSSKRIRLREEEKSLKKAIRIVSKEVSSKEICDGVTLFQKTIAGGKK